MMIDRKKTIGEELNLRVGHFSFDLMQTVIQQCREQSRLENSDAVYSKLEQLWNASFARKGGVPIHGQPIKRSISTTSPSYTDIRLSTPLPRPTRMVGLEGLPPPFLPTIDTMQTLDLTQKPSRLMKFKAGTERLFKKARHAPNITNILECASASIIPSGFQANPSQDVVLGSLVVLDEHYPARVIQIQRDKHNLYENNKKLKLKLRLSAINVNILEGMPNIRVDKDRIGDEVTIDWPSDRITLPFSSSLSTIIDNSGSNNVEIVTTDNDLYNPIGAAEEALSDLDNLLDDVLQGLQDDDEDSGIYGEIVTMPSSTSASNSSSNGTSNRSNNSIPLSRSIAQEDLLLVTGEHISTQSLEELESYFQRLKSCRKRFVILPSDTNTSTNRSEDGVIELDAVEDPTATIPEADIVLIGKLSKVRYLNTYRDTLLFSFDNVY
jgi:hypothetical protein